MLGSPTCSVQDHTHALFGALHIREEYFLTQNRNEKVPSHVCVAQTGYHPDQCFAPTKNNGKLDSGSRFIDPWLVLRSSNTSKSQPINNLSDVSRAILRYRCLEPQYRAFRREQKLLTQSRRKSDFCSRQKRPLQTGSSSVNR